MTRMTMRKLLKTNEEISRRKLPYTLYTKVLEQVLQKRLFHNCTEIGQIIFLKNTIFAKLSLKNNFKQTV